MPDDVSLSPVYARRDGVSLLILPQLGGLPAVAHWGADLGELDAEQIAAVAAATVKQTAPGTLDVAWRVPLLPLEADAWPGRPGLQLRRGGGLVYPRWHDIALSALDSDAPPTAAVVHAASDGIRLETVLRLEPGGLVSLISTVTNTGSTELEVDWLEATMPVPKRADHFTDFDGRWTREKAPYTREMPHGSTLRQTRRGRDGHDATTLSAASIGSPRNRSGEIWAVHLGWSGDTSYRLDRTTDTATLLGAGELLRPREILLAPGERYETPVAYFAYSDVGWDGISARFHDFVRASRPAPRAPLTLNTWEAVYFDHDPQRLAHLAETAAQLGIERFVLDDGWFLARRDDHRGLGDWQVDRAVWPDGLQPLAEQVHGLGMEFGLWFEPEMINQDSELARAHPDWLLHHHPLAAPTGISWRDQHVLDLAIPDAWQYLFDAMSGLVAELGIDFIKWDHNRDLVEAEHEGRPGVHAQTRAAYRLMSALKQAHPGLEIESCSSGGARTDLGVMAIADRVWASDSNDAIERQDIQRWTQLILPPEYIGSHVGPSPAHSSGRVLDLSFRMLTALMGSAGFEWDIAACDAEERASIARFAGLYRELRPVIHGGRAVHDEVRDRALRTVGYVTPDASQAVYTIAAVATVQDAMPERIALHGLDPDAHYRVRVRTEAGAAAFGWWNPGWLADPEAPVVLSGRVLQSVGLQPPSLWPAQALLLHLQRV